MALLNDLFPYRTMRANVHDVGVASVGAYSIEKRRFARSVGASNDHERGYRFATSQSNTTLVTRFKRGYSHQSLCGLAIWSQPSPWLPKRPRSPAVRACRAKLDGRPRAGRRWSAAVGQPAGLTGWWFPRGRGRTHHPCNLPTAELAGAEATASGQWPPNDQHTQSDVYRAPQVGQSPAARSQCTCQCGNCRGNTSPHLRHRAGPRPTRSPHPGQASDLGCWRDDEAISGSESSMEKRCSQPRQS
jgi:hypothetical protein